MKLKLIEIKDLTKIFKIAESTLTVLKGISFSVEQGELLSITGTSGSGKSTLMHLIGCLDIATSGTYLLEGNNVSTMNPNQLAHIRNNLIGFVFQKFYLLPDLTALDNVALPLLYAGFSENVARERAKEVLDLVGLNDRMYHYPNQLSGGQQQRVAIARAMANHPSLILADEPTGNLDSKTGSEIMNRFIELNRTKKVTIIIVTHDLDLAQKTDRIIKLFDGRIIEDLKLK
jgi:putative ABC transport system ATP-binding protein